MKLTSITIYRLGKWLLRLTPLAGARECRVPGWRATTCDTSRLETGMVVPPKTGRSQNGTIWLHDYQYPEDCQHPDCRQLRAAAYARALAAAAPPAGEGRE